VRAVLTEQFVRSFITAPPEIQKTFGKQLALFLRDRRHPSLQASTTGPKAARTTFSRSSRTPSDGRIEHRGELRYCRTTR